MSDGFLFWEDREIRFDVGRSLLQAQKGELIVSQANDIEDSKGNPGENGMLQLSDRRCIWYQISDPKINLSVGYDCILTVDPKVQPIKQGLMLTVNIKAKQKTSRFEFIFQSSTQSNPKIFEILKKLHLSYEQTKLYRDIKARGAITENKNLITFPKEKVINRYINIQSLSSDNSIISGILYLTNVRICWYAVTQESFNISIPWICIKQLKKKEMKTGNSMLIETRQAAGGYIVGYKGNGIEKILVECQKLFQTFIENPVFGVELELSEGTLQKHHTQQAQFDEDVDIIDHGYNELKMSSKQYAIDNQNEENQQAQIIFSNELGLAIEKPPKGMKVEDLWRIINIK